MIRRVGILTGGTQTTVLFSPYVINTSRPLCIRPEKSLQTKHRGG